MIHSEAEEFLLAFAEGTLGPELQTALAKHTRACSACQNWMGVYHLLSQEFSAEADHDHPNATVLARCAARPHAVSDAEGLYAFRHLESCSQCARELALLQAALVGARSGSQVEDVSGGAWRNLYRRHRHGLVAAVLVVAISLGCIVGAGLLRRTHGTESEADQPRILAVGPPGPAETGDLSGGELDGIRVIESRSGLRISDLRVKNGARVTIRAGGGVAFGDGFKVDSGASLTVDGGASRPPH